MTTTIRPTPRHRADPGNPSLRLDPYVIGNSTFTLEAWRRAQGPDRRAAKPRRSTRARSRTAPR